MNDKLLTVILVCLVVLLCCCFGAAITGAAFYSYNIERRTPTITPVIETITTTPTVSGDACVRGGCSNQLCMSESDLAKQGVTTCEWTKAYGCYDQAVCERQQSGECGWTYTEAFHQCMETGD